jgi:tRNA threonylcarbamoyladenosine biosynthesis protein TsaB
VSTILAIDTSSHHASVSLWHDEKLTVRDIDSPKAQAEKILTDIESLLFERGIALSDLQALAVSQGPGSFIGLRVGISVVQSLSYACHIPIVAVNSLLILARQAYRKQGCTNLLVANDARMQEIYWAHYQRVNEQLASTTGMQVTSVEELITQFDSNTMIVGDAILEYSSLSAHFIHHEVLYADPMDLIALAIEAFEAGEVLRPEQLVPEYVRHKVAEKRATPKIGA